MKKTIHDSTPSTDSERPETGLRIDLLGQPQLTRNGNRLDEKLLHKARALLFYLAANRQPHSRDRLGGLLWPEMPDDKARVNLRTALSRLRRVADDVVVTDRRTVELADAVMVDLDLFAQGVAGGDSAEKAHAVTLYRGDFLSDFFVKGATEYEEWSLVQRERLRQQSIDCLDQLTHHFEATGDHQSALRYTQQLLTVDPWREAAHRSAMRLLDRLGQRTAALAQYERCRTTLERELGLAPAPATVQLFERIRDSPQTPHSAPVEPTAQPQPLPNNLPNPATSFHGRSTERQQIADTLAEAGCRLLTLVGMGGIGKSRLALESAQILVTQGTLFTDGVYWVPLASVETRSGVVQAIATALQLPLSGRGPLDKRLHDYLRTKRVLLVLDNLEQLIDEAPVLSDLLTATGHVCLLVTSRERLNLIEEWVLRVGGLPISAEIPQPNNPPAAIALFVQRARRHDLSFRLANNAAAVQRICQLVEGMPLGIELATAWLHAMSAGEIADAIAANVQTLTGERNRPTRHLSLEAVLDHSWQLLTAHERTALARLSLFRGGFSAEAAQHVAQTDRRTLATLVEKSLVQQAGGGRYDLHSLIRQLLALRLTDSAETDQRHRTWFADRIASEFANLSSADQTATLKRLQPDEANLRVAWQRATAAADVTHLARSVDGIAMFYSAQGLHELGRDLMQPTMAWLETADIDTRLRATLLVNYARFAMYMMRGTAEAGTLFHQALALATELDDLHLTARAAQGLGFDALMAGRYKQAEAQFEQAITAAESSQSHQVHGVALQMLAFVLMRKGAYQTAHDMALRSVNLLREHGTPTDIAASLTTLGNYYNTIGRSTEATVAFEEVLHISRAHQHPIGIGNALTGLFVAAHNEQAWETAIGYATDALEQYEAVGDLWGVAIGKHNMGAIRVEQSRFEAAKRLYRESAETYEELGARSTGLANSLAAWGMACVRLGELDEAQAILDRALMLSLAIDSQRFVDKTLLIMGQRFAALGDGRQAAALYQHVVQSEAASSEVREDAVRLSAEMPPVTPHETEQIVSAILANAQSA